MSGNLSAAKVAIFGPGSMGCEFFKVCKALDVLSIDVIGRENSTSLEIFRKKTDVLPFGSVESWHASRMDEMASLNAIVAVTGHELSKTALKLMNLGVRKILLEKPAGLSVSEVVEVSKKATETKTQILVGYNRRFYGSTLKAQDIIKNDGGVLSFNFEFTEWANNVVTSVSNKDVLASWFYANSTHVIDLAFFLGGRPSKLVSFVSGGLPWHPKGSVFAGSGVTEEQALFSYSANWEAPGRWGLEIMTKTHRLIFRPFEKLHVQKHSSVSIEPIEYDVSLDLNFKPGLFLQTRNFLEGGSHKNFVTIQEHARRMTEIYAPILEGG
jgi:predicted dehydrogenase